MNGAGVGFTSAGSTRRPVRELKLGGRKEMELPLKMCSTEATRAGSAANADIAINNAMAIVFMGYTHIGLTLERRL